MRRARVAMVVLVAAAVVMLGGVASAEVTFTEAARQQFGVDENGVPLVDIDGVPLTDDDGQPLTEPANPLMARAWQLFWMTPEGQRIFQFADGVSAEFVIDVRPEAEVGDGDAYGTAQVTGRNEARVITRIDLAVRNENTLGASKVADTIYHEFRHGEFFLMGDEDHDHDTLDAYADPENLQFRADRDRVEQELYNLRFPSTPHWRRIMEQAEADRRFAEQARMVGDILEGLIDSIPSNQATFTADYLDIDAYQSGTLRYTVEGVTVTFNESAFECGDRSATRVVVCADPVLPMPPGAVVFSSIVTIGEIPLSGPDSLIYGAVFDSDLDPDNNWVPIDPFAWDLFQATDRWYQLIYDHTSDTWSLHVSQLSSDGQITGELLPSTARVVVQGDAVVFFISADEFPADRPLVRQTSFGHDGTFSPDHRGADVSGDDPTVPPVPITDGIVPAG